MRRAFLDLVQRRLAEVPACWCLGIGVSRHGLSAPDGRVVDMPVCEESFLGIGAGLSRTGAEVFVDLMYETFTCRGWDVLVNQVVLSDLRPASCGPMTIRMLSGPFEGAGPQHGAGLTGLLARLPSVLVAAPLRSEDIEEAWQQGLASRRPLVLLTVDEPLPGGFSGGGCGLRRIVRWGPESPRTVVSHGRYVAMVADALRHLGAERQVAVVSPLFLNPLPAADLTVLGVGEGRVLVVEGRRPSVLSDAIAAAGAGTANGWRNELHLVGAELPGEGFSRAREVWRLAETLRNWLEKP